MLIGCMLVMLVASGRWREPPVSVHERLHVRERVQLDDHSELIPPAPAEQADLIEIADIRTAQYSSGGCNNPILRDIPSPTRVDESRPHRREPFGRPASRPSRAKTWTEVLSLLSTPYSYAQAVAYSQGDTHILSGSVEVIWCRPLPAEQSPGEQRHHDQHLQQRRAVLQIGNRRIDPIQQVCHGRAGAAPARGTDEHPRLAGRRTAADTGELVSFDCLFKGGRGGVG